MTSRRVALRSTPAMFALGLLLGSSGMVMAQAMFPAPTSDVVPADHAGTPAGATSSIVATTSAPAASASTAGALAGSASVATTPVAVADDDIGQPFTTKYAQFVPVPFRNVPGWSTDSLRESLAVFRRSCKVLARKSAWTEACAGLSPTDDSDDDAARHYFETHFQVYQVHNPDASLDGRITGYYEPELDGSISRTERYHFPVYAEPNDLYLLDARSLSGASRQWFRIEENRLLAAAPNTAGSHEYELALASDSPGVADKRFRVRVEGNRLVPYYQRQQIEAQGIDAQIIAWVNDPYALYSMQVQGSGKIRLPDGNLIRVAYAQQNGHPFLPNASASDIALAEGAIKTRGLRLGSSAAAGTAASAPNDDVASIIAQLKRSGSPTAAPVAASPPPATNSAAATPPAALANSSTAQRDAQVQAIISQLKHGQGATPVAATAPPLPAVVNTTAPKARDPQVRAMIAQLLGKASPPATAGNSPVIAAGNSSGPAPVAVSGSRAALLAVDPGYKAAAKAGGSSNGQAGGLSGIGDPSYVFFRVIPDSAQGPLGALGVPLTAGRSLAVDPRTTPLGAPVFITTAAPGGAGQIDRLMFAQDTGGAIRGSVRGDFFWGFGDDAGSMAASMNANGRMWLLLPRGLTLGALSPRARTRSLGNSAMAPDCVIPDDESCVED